MSIAYDGQKRAQGPEGRLGLVQAIFAAPVTESEPDWVEWKGPVGDVVRWAPRIAKYILGFANRPVPDAVRFAGGYAYLVLGAEPTTVHGVMPVDFVQLVRAIRQYTGVQGPAFEPYHVELAGKSVLVVEVEPPKLGHPIFRVRKAFQGLIDGDDFSISDGDVFIRAGSETRRARSGEQDLLDARAAAGSQELDITVEDRSGEWRAASASSEPRNAFIAAEKARLLKPLVADTRGGPEIAAQRLLRSSLDSELRNEPDYRAAVDAYLAEVDAAWPLWARHFAVAEHLAILRLSVRNNTTQNFAAVEIIATLKGRVYGCWRDDDEDSPLPSPPKLWGSQTRLAGLMGAAFTMPYDPAMNAIQRPRRRDIDNSASARIPFGVLDLRPEAIVGLDDVFLAIDPSHVGGTIRVECAATSKNVGGVYRQTIGHAVAVEAAIPVVKAPRTRP